MNITNYTKIHGRKPHGTGQWAFKFYMARHYNYCDIVFHVPSTCAYSAAYKWAVRHGNKIGAAGIALMP